MSLGLKIPWAKQVVNNKNKKKSFKKQNSHPPHKLPSSKKLWLHTLPEETSHKPLCVGLYTANPTEYIKKVDSMSEMLQCK